MKDKAIEFGKFSEIVPGIFTMKIPFGAVWTTVILVKGDELVLIDSGPDSEKAGSFIMPALAEIKINPKEIKLLLNTHCHGDHIGGHFRFCEITGVPAAVFRQAEEKITDPLKYSKKIRARFPGNSPEAPAGLRGVVPARLLDERETAAGRLKLFHTPGHDTDSLCWFDEKTGTLLSGDSVQGSGALGNALAFYQDLRAYQTSLELLQKLNAENLAASHYYRPFGELASGKKAVKDYLQASLESIDRYDAFIKTQSPCDVEQMTLRLIEHEAQQKPPFLFLEMYTVSEHMKSLKKLHS